MGQMIKFDRPDGGDCPAYVAEPAAGATAPALVVIQEWWGLNEQMKRLADRFAATGYRALVPDLYRGKLPQNEDEANHHMGELDFMDAAGQDVLGALTHLKKTSSKAGVTGFCMGGALTILAAAKLDVMDAGACFYGIPPAEAADPATITTPMMYHFANTDDWCTPAAVDALEAKLKQGKGSWELFRYDAKHGFMRDGSAVHHAESANLAWERTIAFFGKTLT
jgi:carboxymethylenebutenolidase